MSRPTDRVGVPTNGHRPRLSDDEPDELADASDLGAGAPSFELPEIRAQVPNITPTQAAVGFGIVAAIILFLLGRRRAERD